MGVQQRSMRWPMPRAGGERSICSNWSSRPGCGRWMARICEELYKGRESVGRTPERDGKKRGTNLGH